MRDVRLAVGSPARRGAGPDHAVRGAGPDGPAGRRRPAGLAAAVLAAVVVLSLGIPASRCSGPRSTVVLGGLSGPFNGLAGMPGPPVIAFYLASGLGSAHSRACMIVLFLLTSVAALVPLALAHALTVGGLGLAAGGFPAVWIGSQAGGRLYARSSDVVCRMAGLTVLAVTALVTACKALGLPA